MQTHSVENEPSALQREDELIQATAAMEEALAALEAAGGKLAEGADKGQVRVYSPLPLRAAWNTYKLQVQDHLETETGLLPLIVQANADEAVLEHLVGRLLAEHEALLCRAAEVRKVFLGVRPLRQAFSRVEQALEEHARTQDTGVLRDAIERLAVDLSARPSLRRYLQVDPTQGLRSELSHTPDPLTNEEARGLVDWFKQRFSRRPKIRY